MIAFPKKLKEPFLAALEKQSLPAGEVREYLKGLRFYLDFCAKYRHPPRDRDSLPLFMQKLASKHQMPEQQEQAAASVEVYYALIAEWTKAAAAGQSAPILHDPWEACYRSLKEEVALRHYSPKTLSTYRTWIRQFQGWLDGKQPDDVDSKDARGFLTYLAVERHVSASTQNQAFNALLFLYRHILDREYDIGQEVVRARRTKYIPVVLSREEVDRVVDGLHMPYKLIVRLLYGCGLRMSECLNLRVQYLKFD
jgi:hypothetical protein